MLFWFSLLSVVYTYVGYPLVLLMLSLFRNREVNHDDDYYPSVTLIITVHNEEKRIAEKIQNTLELEYPQDKLDTLFA